MTGRDQTPYAQIQPTVRPDGPRRGYRPLRQPSTEAEMYEWHRDALAGLEPPMQDFYPQAGWYKRRQFKGGPYVPVEIWIDQVIDPETGELADDEIAICTVAGVVCDPRPIWTHLRPISRAEFDDLSNPQPKKKVNLMKATGPHG